jgi:uncharacterized protein (TIGR02594 family)
MAVLKRGSRHRSVRNLQYLLNLNLIPDPKLSVDGIFGPGTEKAVRQFQAQEGLKVDGIVGPKTWFELGDLGVEEMPVCGGAIPTWMHIALGEMKRGIREVSGTQHNPRIIEYHKTTTLQAGRDESAWCSSFTNWCMKQSGLAGTDKANARSWLDWGSEITQPRYGCVVVLWREDPSSWKGHVGFFLAHRNAKKMLLLGGNQGDSVSIAAYPRHRLLSYRWPSGA